MGVFEKIKKEMAAMEASRDSNYTETFIGFRRNRRFLVECEREMSEDDSDGEVCWFGICFIKNGEDADCITIYPGEDDTELAKFVRTWTGEKKDGSMYKPVMLKDGRSVSIEDLEEALKYVDEALGPDICGFIRQWDDEMFEDWEYIQKEGSRSNHRLKDMESGIEYEFMELKHQVDALDEMLHSGHIGRLHMELIIEKMNKSLVSLDLLRYDDGGE